MNNLFTHTSSESGNKIEYNKVMQCMMKIIKTTLFACVTFALALLTSSKTVYAYDDIVVVIDPGHGGVVTADNSNGGCIYNGVQEKDATLVTATALYNELSQYQNVTVYMTRNSDVEMSINDRIAFAQNVGANVVVSVHYNASGNHNFYGSEIFTSMYGQPYATGKGLASCIMKRWTEFGTVSKGIKTRKGNNGDYYGLIRKGCEIGMPVIILEHGYFDNSHDFDRIGNTAAWQQLGIMDAQGIAEYYGFRKDTVAATITPTVQVPAPVNPVLPDSTEPVSVKLVIDSYDKASGEIKYSLSAADNESDLMYFGFEFGDVNKDTVFDDLYCWDRTKGVQKGTITAPKGYDGNITARVYNIYELSTDSEAVNLGKVAGSINGDSAGGDSADGNSVDGDSNGGSSKDKTDKDKDSGQNNAEEQTGDLTDEADSENLDSVPGDEDNPETKIIDEIILGDQREEIKITPSMVDEAMESKSQSNKAIIGLAITGSVVALAVAIAVAVIIYNNTNKRKKKEKSSRKRGYDWEE